MIRLSFALALAISACFVGAVAHSDDAAPALMTTPSDAPKAPAKPAKKAAHKNPADKSAKSKQSAEDDEKAARLEEGRKKFFERSMGFDNGGGSDSPITLQGGNGLTPGAGFKF